MCGIAGIVGNYAIDDLKQMLASTKHRGPDHTGIYHDEHLAIGMNRLSIIDLSAHANQPQTSTDGRFVIVFNGEIYNYIEIRSTLLSKGYSFKTNSDTEVLLTGYAHFGKEILKLIRGMFAFAIWDKQDKSLFIARDQLGIKPLLYAEHNSSLIFCSELKGFLATTYHDLKKLNIEAVHNFISLGHQVAPNTMLEKVKSLLPGHFMWYNKGKLSIEKYWQVSTMGPDNSLIDYDLSVAHLRELVLESVEEELLADVPVGVFLSGGLDSGIVTAAASLITNRKKINTFTIGFADAQSEFDESNIAKSVAKHFNTNHHEILINPNQATDLFDDFVRAIDQPSRDGLNTYIVSKHVSNHVKVALSGLGGDELFAGYNGMFKYLKSSKFNANIQLLLKGISPIRNVSSKMHNKMYAETSKLNFIQNYIVNLQPHLNNNLNRYFNVNADSNIRTYETIYNNYKFANEPINKIRTAYIQLFMSNMLLRDGDATSMKHSIEVRFPLIDHRLVQLALTMPQKFVIKNLHTASQRNYTQSGLKQMLYHAFEKELPTNLYNQSKRGFQLPIYHWLTTSYKDKLEDTIFNSSALFNKKSLINSYNKGHFGKNKTKDMWGILILDQWLKTNGLSS